MQYQVNDDGRVRAVVDTYTAGSGEDGGTNVAGFANAFPTSHDGTTSEIPIDTRYNPYTTPTLSPGTPGERQVRERTESATFFVGGLQDRLSDEKKAGRHTLAQLRSLVDALDSIEPVPVAVRRGPQPVFDRDVLTAAVVDATASFHTRWRATLGLRHDPEHPKEHWSRIKALTRRLALGEEEYRELKPAGELRYELQARIFRMLQEPVEWRGGELDDDERDELLLAATHTLTGRLIDLTTSRVLGDRQQEWIVARDQAGSGSTAVRARIVENDIFEPAAPTGSARADNPLVDAVTATVSDVGADVGFVLR